MEGRGEDVGVVDVRLLDRGHRVDRGDAEAAAALLVEDRREDGGRVEPWVAEPIDGPPGRHQGSGFAIADQSVGIHCLTLQRHIDNGLTPSNAAGFITRRAEGDAPA